uniref:Reticulophagy regulator 1 n=1 Tax=Stegastes partitus TaxID=144197 RepID=A0A3B4ZNA3_9TELE
SVTEFYKLNTSDGRSGAGLQLSDSLKLFLQETSAFKQQNPGKFCLLVCSLCTFFAVIGRYIPGIVISYVLVLGVFLWPLISSHEVSLWLEPVLQKLDFGIGEFFQKIKDNHSKYYSLDSAVCKEMSVSDTEVSDMTWTDNGTFNLSEGNTPQTENSEAINLATLSGVIGDFSGVLETLTQSGVWSAVQLQAAGQQDSIFSLLQVDNLRSAFYFINTRVIQIDI